MSKKNLICRFGQALKMALAYGDAHASSQKAMKKEYANERHDEKLGDHFLTKITIKKQGNMYQVTQLFYVNGWFKDQNDWIATYGWHSNGHLMAIGSSRYLIFDPTEKLLYLEEWIDDEKTMRIYYQNK